MTAGQPETKIKSMSQNDEISESLIERAIELAIEEDLGADGLVNGRGDLTCSAIVDESLTARATVLLKQPGVIAGTKIFERIMKRFSNHIKVSILVEDGTYIDQIPAEILKIEGPARSIITAERTALNLIQRMSGVATMTRKFVDKTKGSAIAILDTRKTTPCLRALEKYAVRAAGGTNHRFGLFDMVMIKENHIEIAGSIKAAVDAVRKMHGTVHVEVEARDLKEVSEAVENGADRVLLDNMTPEMVTRAIELVAGRCLVEVSGGVNLTNIDGYLLPGVDAISIGALTHSAPAIDLSLEVELPRTRSR